MSRLTFEQKRARVSNANVCPQRFDLELLLLRFQPCDAGRMSVALSIKAFHRREQILDEESE